MLTMHVGGLIERSDRTRACLHNDEGDPVIVIERKRHVSRTFPRAVSERADRRVEEVPARARVTAGARLRELVDLFGDAFLPVWPGPAFRDTSSSSLSTVG